MPHTVFVGVYECFCIINKYYTHLYISMSLCNVRVDMANEASTVDNNIKFGWGENVL